MMMIFYYSKGMQSEISRRKQVYGETSRGSRGQLPRALSSWSHTKMLIPSHELWQPVRHAVTQRSSVKTQCSASLLGAGHVSTSCFKWTKIPHSQEENTAHHKPYCLFSQLRNRETLFSVTEWWNPLEIRVFRRQPGPTLFSGISQEVSVRFAMRAVVCPATLDGRIWRNRLLLLSCVVCYINFLNMHV